jgi:predicted metal-dependent peptidase
MTTTTELTPDQVKNDAAFAERLHEITFAMYRAFPFFAILAESFSIRTSREIPTACVDNKGRITFNPDFVTGLNDRQFIFVFAHEVFHPAFRAFERQGTRDPLLWNMAHDYAINLLIRDHFARPDAVPSGMLIDDKYADMSAEQIYEHIVRNAIRAPKSGMTGDMVQGGGDGSGESGDGESGDGESGGSDFSDVKNVRDARAKTPKGDGAWESAVAAAAYRAKQMGNLPSRIEREVDKFIKSKVDWVEQLRQLLRHNVSRVNRDQYTFLPCNRRLIHQGIYFPSLVGFDAPKIAFAIDTSGSMGQAEVSQAHAEIDSIRKQFGCPVYIMSCDADVHSGEWVDPYSPLPMPIGGGGTDFRPVFEHIEKNRVPVDVVVYLTDGYGNFGGDPGIETIWVMTTHEVPPWGNHIQIGVDS